VLLYYAVMNNINKKYALAFSYLCNFSFSLYKRLLKSFGSLEKAFYASETALLNSGIKESLLCDFIKRRKSFSWDEVQKDLADNKISFCFIEDDCYPKYLKNIYNPPPLFYYRGDLFLDWSKGLAVVGSRNYSFYGEKIVEEVVPGLSQSGLIIISGLAFGIDSLAHSKTLESGGKTVAVLGSGLDKNSIYPYANRFLAEEIVSGGGLLLSEFPPYTKPLAYHFPQRNRIIAGLSLATLVVEAGAKSGSLITAELALDEGREVFSIPGDIFKENLAGNNKLLQKGASLVMSINDILAYFDIILENVPGINLSSPRAKYEPQSETESFILELLRRGPVHIDDILKLHPQNIQNISSSLILLEINGVIRNSGAKNYELV